MIKKLYHGMKVNFDEPNLKKLEIIRILFNSKL